MRPFVQSCSSFDETETDPTAMMITMMMVVRRMARKTVRKRVGRKVRRRVGRKVAVARFYVLDTV